MNDDIGCRELVEVDGRWAACGLHPAHAVVEHHARSGTRLSDLGRRPILGGPYCEAHGGRGRALAETHADFGYLAPDAVGDDESVLQAGTASLASTEVYLVVRRVADEQTPALWRVRIPVERRDVWPSVRHLGLSTGCCTSPDEASARSIAERVRAWGVVPTLDFVAAGTRARARPWLAQLGVGSRLLDIGAYATREEAMVAGQHAWRTRRDARVTEILVARGGTLDWGLPVTPLTEPAVLEPSDGASAWDAAGQS